MPIVLKLVKFSVFLAVSLLLLMASCYFWVSNSSKKALYSDMTRLPYQRVALVFGTSKYLSGKIKNQYYHTRIAAAAKLYRAGKVDYFIVSGDNRKHSYNEPQQMKKDLIAAGVPAARIQPDYAGFRTLDSVLRMQKVFGHSEYLIISQRFHNQRALFLARAHGQHPIAFNADNPSTQSMNRVLFREVFARVKAVLDVLFDKQAKFYGDKIIFPPVP